MKSETAGVKSSRRSAIAHSLRHDAPSCRRDGLRLRLPLAGDIALTNINLYNYYFDGTSYYDEIVMGGCP